MALLGTLAVDLIANTKKFESNMKGAGKRVTTFQSVIKGATSTLGLFGVALGGAAIVGFVNKQRQLIDELAKSSRRLNLTTQALGSYQFAAGLSGVSTQELQVGLERMQDTIGAALLGEGGAIKAFDALGVSAQQLSKSDRPLELIQKRITGIQDQNIKIALSRDVFGRSAGKLLNLFEADLAGVTNQYKELGLAVTSEEAKRIEEFNDKLSILSQRFASVGRNLLIDISEPALAALGRIEEILSFTKNAGTNVGSSLSGGGSEGTLQQVQIRERSLFQKLTSGGLPKPSTATIGTSSDANAIHDALALDRQVY